jgi:hypothetical protein
MALPAQLLALCDEMPMLLCGPLAGRSWWMPKAGVTRQQLGTAGATSGTLRRVRLYAIRANGRMVTSEQDVRIWDGTDALAAPAGWIGGQTAQGTARPLPAGVVVIGGRNIGIASAEGDPVEVAHDHFVAVTALATAQPVLNNGSLGPVQRLPFGVVAGPDYGWRNPAGPPGSLAPVPPVETSAGAEWPPEAPLR